MDIYIYIYIYIYIARKSPGTYFRKQGGDEAPQLGRSPPEGCGGDVSIPKNIENAFAMDAKIT